ncbi:hypothetical protein BDV93DRAFT_527371, partial [Ceratobasidium sp. AG-I]
MSTAFCVALIPELISTIAGFLNISDLVPLMRVSRHFFRIAGPLIWRDVPDIEVLMRLVPGAMQKGIQKLRRFSLDYFGWIITLPDTPDFTRFNIYAPWVQRLEVFKRLTAYTFRYSRRLIEIIAKQPLLPNLHALSLHTEVKIASEDYESLIELFVCPSLTEIRHTSDDYVELYLRPSSAHLLMQKISDVCPGLQKLEFFPDTEKFSKGVYSELVSSPNAAFPRCLAGLSSLQSFSSTVVILEPGVLQVLGSLPLLESLSILDYNSEGPRPPPLDEHFQVPDTWFSALRSLQIHDLNPRDISAIWAQPPLVQNLLSIIIRCYPGEHEPEQTELPIGQEWINKFLSDLPRASS